MNCIRCQYLLWDLTENRCPECGLAFEATDYSFIPKAVHFVCPHCGQSYLGSDELGLPTPRRFVCVRCGDKLDAAQMQVRPILEDARGEPLRFGTAWQSRGRVGFFRAFLDGLANLATQPGEYFRRSAISREQGALGFSVLCAYLATAMLIALMIAVQSWGLLTWLPDARRLLQFPLIAALVVAIPCLQVAWNYLYGFLIQTVLWGLGQPSGEYEQSVRAVAYGSAVLPAVILLPLVGLPWYVFVVAAGVEHFHETSRSRAVTATLVPMLLAANLGLAAAYAAFWS